MSGMSEYNSNFPPKKMPNRDRFCINCGVVKHKQLIKGTNRRGYREFWMCLKCTAEHRVRKV